jgi:hypothetical protein
MTWLSVAKFCRSVRNTFSLATREKSPPAAFTIACRLSNTRRMWISIGPCTSSPVAGSSGICPETYTVLPHFTACEYVPTAFGACAVLTIVRVMASLPRWSSG